MADGIGILVGKFIGLPSHIREITDGYAIFISAVLVIIGWYISKRATENSERRKNAHKYIIEHNDELKKLISSLSDNLREKKPFLDYKNSSEDKTDSEKETYRNLQSLLAKMEVLSTDIRHGLVSEKYIRDTQFSIIVNIFELSKGYISTARDLRKQPSAYTNFECLYIRYRYKKTSIIQKS